MSKNVETTEEVTHEEHVAEVKANKLDIINGRMPLAVVFVIRFQEDAEAKDNVLAKKYHTSPGKISDVRKGRNFIYVDADFKPSAAEIDLGLAWADQMAERGSEDDAVDLTEALTSLVVATDAESEAQAVARKATRKPRGKKAEAETDAADAPEAPVELDEELDGDEEDDLDDLLED